MNNETITVVLTTLLSFTSYCFGVNPAIEALLWAITLDIFIGVLASFVNEKLCYNSRRMYKGIVKKIIILALVAFSHQLDVLMHTDIIGLTTTYYFIVNEALSCFENACKCGLTVPKVLYKSLEQLKGLENEKYKNH